MRIYVVQKVIDYIRRKKTEKPSVTYKNVKEILRKDLIKLHLGCGTVYKDGWINIDNNSDMNIDKLDFVWDLRKPLPFPENSVDFIYNEHFLEHLTTEEGGGAYQKFNENFETKWSIENCNA